MYYVLFSDPFQTWANKESILKLNLRIICVWRRRQFMDIHLIPLPFHIKDIKKCLIKMDYFKVEEGHLQRDLELKDIVMDGSDKSYFTELLRCKIHIFYTKSSLLASHECPTLAGVNLPQSEVHAICEWPYIIDNTKWKPVSHYCNINNDVWNKL